ncbi:Huntingtin, partial [Stegodyphus mimosarum]
MIGHFLLHSSQETGGWWSKWLSNQSVTGSPTLLNLLSKLTSVVQDDSSVASKLGLVGLKQCINMLLNSLDALECFHLLETLLQVKDNSYWLTKIELAEVVSSISFKVVNYLEGESTRNNPLLKSTCYQDKFLNGILIPLLGDEDFRVRQASAIAIVKLVPKFFFPIDHPNKDAITAIAKESTDIYLNMPNKGSSHSTLPLVHALVKPFAVQSSCSYNSVIDASLSRIVNLLVTTLRMCTNKFLIYGCCHALCLLSEEFLVTVFPETWNAVFSAFKYESVYNESCPQLLQPCVGLVSESASNDTFSQTSDILCHLISLITHTSVCLDLVAHQHVLQLTGNLLCGLWYKFLVESRNSNYQELKQDVYVFPLVEKLFLHLMRVLNIFTHVLEEQYPICVSNRPALPSLPNAPSLSPIKRKSKVKDEPVTSSSVKGSPSKGIDKSDTEKERTSKISGTLGQFHTFPLYMKLYEILRGAYGSYKISMDFQSSEKFCHLLKCTLDVMSQILEVSESHEMGKSAEEILSYLKSLMVMESCSSVQCVRQLLKSLFGTNLIALCQEALLVPGMCSKGNGSSRLSATVPGLYHTVISYPYTDFTHVLKDKTIKCLSSEGNDELVSFRCLNWVKHGSGKITNLSKSGSKGEKANLAAHIRLFEAVVIRALQQYTISSDVTLQCQVLDLLAQLVQLRVNYCLLDADQIFIHYVIKQFEFIEEGQIANADILIPRIFYFLILLSYERYHSKPIISVPKILQLCDSLIASGQPPDKYVVRALQPVIEDLFLIK